MPLLVHGIPDGRVVGVISRNWKSARSPVSRKLVSSSAAHLCLIWATVRSRCVMMNGTTLIIRNIAMLRWVLIVLHVKPRLQLSTRDPHLRRRRLRHLRNLELTMANLMIFPCMDILIPWTLPKDIRLSLQVLAKTNSILMLQMAWSILDRVLLNAKS